MFLISNFLFFIDRIALIPLLIIDDSLAIINIIILNNALLAQ